MVALLPLALLAAPLAAEAQPAGKVYRIGFLGPTASLAALAVFDSQVSCKGSVNSGTSKARNIVFEVRSAEGKYERLPRLAAELVEHRRSTSSLPPATRRFWPKQATSTVPIVMTACDALEVGLIVQPGAARVATSPGSPAISGELGGQAASSCSGRSCPG